MDSVCGGSRTCSSLQLGHCSAGPGLLTLQHTPQYTQPGRNIINPTKKTYSGLLALDIDETLTTIKNKEFIIKMVAHCHANNIKIILVTSRQIPYQYGGKKIKK